jgi:hypothetical protein
MQISTNCIFKATIQDPKMKLLPFFFGIVVILQLIHDTESYSLKTRLHLRKPRAIAIGPRSSKFDYAIRRINQILKREGVTVEVFKNSKIFKRDSVYKFKVKYIKENSVKESCWARVDTKSLTVLSCWKN